MSPTHVLLLLGAATLTQEAPHLTLQGSPEAMAEQHQVALEHGYPFFDTSEQVEQAAAAGELVRLENGPDYEVADFVDPPLIRPEVLPFVERTGRLYRTACGERLVVTSAVRARENQPPNAHELSVHPAGMAVDFRVSQNPACREWFEEKLLALEEQDLVNATRERSPPHYHVAVYPTPYLTYAATNPLPGPVSPVAAQHAPARGRSGLVVAAMVVLFFLALLIARRVRPPQPDE